MTGDTPTITGSAAEATTAVPLDPRAIMATMGVSCATCRWWVKPDPNPLGYCQSTPSTEDEASAANSGATAIVARTYLLTRASHYCAMFERRA